jgi:hypothetical protein
LDYDIYLQRRGGWGWVTVASSLGLTCDESISYSRSSSAIYRVRVYNYSNQNGN